MEQLDQSADASETDVFPRYVAQLTESTSSRYEPELLGGVVVLEHPGTLLQEPKPALYQAALPDHSSGKETKLRLIPYYAWSNRELSAMQVWVPYQQA
jgi:DUF1680 family protein